MSLIKAQPIAQECICGRLHDLIKIAQRVKLIEIVSSSCACIVIVVWVYFVKIGINVR